MRQLRSNQTNVEVSGAAREGAALLQGLVVCGKCGRRMTVRYTGNGGIVPKYECKGRWEQGNRSVCTSVRATNVDDAIVRRFIDALQPANLELAVQVMDRLLESDDAADRSWRLTLERAEYEVARAERQYQQVEPENRLVARSLESQWNEKLSMLEQLRKEYKEYQAKRNWVPTENDKSEILALAHELPRIWNAPNTTAKDRKRILRTLVEDVTVFAEPRQPDVRLGLRWRSHCCEELHTVKAIPYGTARKHTSQTVERVHSLASTMNDTQIAEHLNASGLKTPEGRDFTANSISWIRYSHNIPLFSPKREGLSVKEVAARFGVGAATVYYWIQHGVVNAHKAAPGCPWDITLSPEKCEELKNYVRDSGHLANNRTLSS